MLALACGCSSVIHDVGDDVQARLTVPSRVLWWTGDRGSGIKQSVATQKQRLLRNE